MLLKFNSETNNKFSLDTVNNYELINFFKENDAEIISERIEKSGSCEMKIACIKSNEYIFNLSYIKLDDKIIDIKREVNNL